MSGTGPPARPAVAAPGEVVHAPHPPLDAYYGTERERRDWVRGVFDRAAPDYERVERAMAFGTGAWYRREALRRAGLRPGMRFVDVGTGTGLVAREAARILGDPAAIVGVDPSPGMLANARHASGVQLLEGAAESLPLPDAAADFLAMGYALRHVSDLAVAFGEFHRVLRPGGIACILEITRPQGRLASAALKLYLRGVVPLVGRLVGRAADTPRLMRYYWDTIESCAEPSRIMATLAHAGFAEVTRGVQLGVFSEYRAVKPR